MDTRTVADSIAEGSDSDVESFPHVNFNDQLANELLEQSTDGWEIPKNIEIPTFRGEHGLRLEVSDDELMEPIKLFKLFISDDTIQDITKQTNAYACQCYSKMPGEFVYDFNACKLCRPAYVYVYKLMNEDNASKNTLRNFAHRLRSSVNGPG